MRKQKEEEAEKLRKAKEAAANMDPDAKVDLAALNAGEEVDIDDI